MIYSEQFSSIIPSILFAVNCEGRVNFHLVYFSPILLIIIGFSVKYLTGQDTPKCISSGKTNKDF